MNTVDSENKESKREERLALIRAAVLAPRLEPVVPAAPEPPQTPEEPLPRPRKPRKRPEHYDPHAPRRYRAKGLGQRRRDP